jgi:hypothetical protein
MVPVLNVTPAASSPRTPQRTWPEMSPSLSLSAESDTRPKRDPLKTVEAAMARLLVDRPVPNDALEPVVAVVLEAVCDAAEPVEAEPELPLDAPEPEPDALLVAVPVKPFHGLCPAFADPTPPDAACAALPAPRPMAAGLTALGLGLIGL